MKLDKETLQRWKEDALEAFGEELIDIQEKDETKGTYIRAKWRPIIISTNLSIADAKHYINAAPQNFIALIEKLERYEEILGESFFLFEGLINTHEAYANMAATIHRELEIE